MDRNEASSMQRYDPRDSECMAGEWLHYWSMQQHPRKKRAVKNSASPARNCKEGNRTRDRRWSRRAVQRVAFESPAIGQIMPNPMSYLAEQWSYFTMTVFSRAPRQLKENCQNVAMLKTASQTVVSHVSCSSPTP